MDGPTGSPELDFPFGLFVPGALLLFSGSAPASGPCRIAQRHSVMSTPERALVHEEKMSIARAGAAASAGRLQTLQCNAENCSLGFARMLCAGLLVRPTLSLMSFMRHAWQMKPGC